MVDDYDEERISASLKGFAEYVKRTPESKAFIRINSTNKIRIYDEKAKKERHLTRLEIKSLMARKKKQVEDQMVETGVDLSRIEIVTGKLQEDDYGDFNWKFWIVPKDGKIPQDVLLNLKRKKNPKKAVKK